MVLTFLMSMEELVRGNCSFVCQCIGVSQFHTSILCFEPPLHFCHFIATSIGIILYWLGILTANVRVWLQTQMCVFKPFSKSMSFLHWLHLKNLPPLHLSAGASIGSGLQTMCPGVFVHLNDESEGRVAKISCERFQKCIRTAPAQVPTAHSPWLA